MKTKPYSTLKRKKKRAPKGWKKFPEFFARRWVSRDTILVYWRGWAACFKWPWSPGYFGNGSKWCSGWYSYWDEFGDHEMIHE